MKIYHFLPEQPPTRLEILEQMPDAGFVWLDFLREEAQGWDAWVGKLLDTRVDFEHIEDSLSSTHVSYFDGMQDYDMLIFEGLGPQTELVPLETRSAAFFVFDRLLVTVRAADAPSFDLVGKRCDGAANGRLPRSAVGLAYRIIDTMVDHFLAMREVFTKRIETMQDAMLHAKRNNTDWRGLMRARRTARRLASLSEDQWEAIDAWRRDSRFDWDDAISVRLRDLSEHITRMRDLAANLERDLDSAIQLNFVLLSQRQNEIMKVFTVVAVIFMPLTLLTGIWGMNFQFMPELHWKYGYLMALGLIIAGGGGMLLWFRRRNFF